MNTLPSPTVTTGAVGQSIGSGAASGATQFGQQTSANANGPYYTGPYGMASQQTATSANVNAGVAPSSYGAAATGASGYGGVAAAGGQPTGAIPAYNGYQSPYQNQATPAANGYRTANVRQSAQPNGAAPLNSAAAGADQWNRNTVANNWQPPASSEYAAPADSQPATGYGTGAWSPPAGTGEIPANTSPASGYQDRFSSPGHSAPGSSPTTITNPTIPRRDGAYRPGSTSRGSLPTAIAATPSVSSSQPPASGAYPATSLPNSGFPSTTPAARTANAASANGGYAYPSAPAGGPSAYPTTGTMR